MNKILRAGVDFAGNIAQLILQARMRPNPIFLFRIEQIHRNLQEMEQENNLSTDFLFFLVQRDYYCSRTKFSRFAKTNINLPVTITLNFDLIHKQNSFSRTAQIWKIILQKKACPQCTELDCLRDIVHLSKQVLDQIKSESIFSDLVGNREAEEKYFIDYRFDMSVGVGGQDKNKSFTGLLWNCQSRVNDEYELQVQCQYNRRQYFGLRSSLRRISRGLRKSTEDTKDSYSLESVKDVSLKRFRSYQEKMQAYQIYDKELQITIVSSDSDSLSNSRQKLQPFSLGESEQYELLFDENNQDQAFLVDNQTLIENWSKLISFK